MTAPMIEWRRACAAEGLTLLPRLGKPEKIGAIIAALASGGLACATGQVISAYAGMLIARV